MAKAPLQTDFLVGVQIRLRRKLIGMSQEKLGQQLGISFQQIQKYEKGTNRVGAGRLQAMATILDVPVEYFFSGLDSTASAQPDRLPALHVMREPGALRLLEAYSRINDPALRKAVVDLAQGLAKVSTSASNSGAHEAAASR